MKVTTNWSGIVNAADFDTSNPNNKRMANYARADEFNKRMKDRAEKGKGFEKYLSMSMEQLRRDKIISNTDGRPCDGLTNDKWQIEYELRKRFVEKHAPDVKRVGKQYSSMTGAWNEDVSGRFYGDTKYKYYCSFMNDVLKNIRRGHTEYCYYIYQVMELYRFDFGEKELKTRYCDGYWEVWLA